MSTKQKTQTRVIMEDYLLNLNNEVRLARDNKDVAIQHKETAHDHAVVTKENWKGSNKNDWISVSISSIM